MIPAVSSFFASWRDVCYTEWCLSFFTRVLCAQGNRGPATFCNEKPKNFTLEWRYFKAQSRIFSIPTCNFVLLAISFCFNATSIIETVAKHLQNSWFLQYFFVFPYRISPFSSLQCAPDHLLNQSITKIKYGITCPWFVEGYLKHSQDVKASCKWREFALRMTSLRLCWRCAKGLGVPYQISSHFLIPFFCEG